MAKQQMVDREKVQWRIIYDVSREWPLPYRVQYKIEGREWKEWRICATYWGARFCMWRAKLISKPIGGEMLVYESPN